MNSSAPDAALESARRVARNTGIQLGGDVLSRIASLAFYLVMAREFGQRGFGNFTLAISVVLLVELAGLGTDQIITREVAREPRRARELFWNVNAVKLALGALAIAAAVGFSLAAGYGTDIRAAVAILGLGKLTEILSKTVHSVFRGIEQTRPVAVSLMLQRFSTAAVGIGALLAGAGLVEVALIYLGGAALGLVYLGLRLRRPDIRPRLNISVARARAVALASLPLGLSLMFGAILARLDTVLLSLLKDIAAVGIYGAAYRLFESTLVIGAWFGLASLPLLSRVGRDTRPTIGRAYEAGCKVLALALLPVGAAFALFASPIIGALYGPQFAQSTSALRLLGGAPVLDGFFILCVMILTAEDRRRALIPIVGFVVAENALLNFLLIPRYSFNGAAAAMTLSQATLTIATVALTLGGTGPISWLRIGLAPIAGCAAMAIVRLGVGENLLALGVALLAYLAVAFAVERGLFPQDLRLLINSLRRRAPTETVTGLVRTAATPEHGDW
jgi:O-antigen/teichoic acid export membrane protein